MQYFSRWNVNQNSALVSIYLSSEEVHVLGHVLAALGAGVVWVGHGAALADLDAGGAVQAGQAGQACGAVSRDLENIPFIQIVSRRLKWLWLGMIKGLNWIKIQQLSLELIDIKIDIQEIFLH